MDSAFLMILIIVLEYRFTRHSLEQFIALECYPPKGKKSFNLFSLFFLCLRGIIVSESDGLLPPANGVAKVMSVCLLLVVLVQT